MSENCGTCHYYRTAGGEADYGECHRHAPRPVGREDTSETTGVELNPVVWDWPVTHKDEGCGEWRTEFPAGTPFSFVRLI